MVDPDEMEVAAMHACLAPLGEYVGSIGMQRPLADYSREEVLTLRRAKSMVWDPEDPNRRSAGSWRIRRPAGHCHHGR